MKELFAATDLQEVLQRIDKLKPDTQRLWGKMDASQMLAHCNAAMEVAIGEKFPPQVFIGKLLGGLVKKSYLGEKPFPKNSPTDKSFIMTGKKDFQKEKENLKQILTRFSEGGAAKCTTHRHSFFGKMTSEEWSILMYKHIDHHLRQFGV